MIVILEIGSFQSIKNIPHSKSFLNSLMATSPSQCYIYIIPHSKSLKFLKIDKICLINPCYIKTKKDESKIKDKDSGLVYELNKETKVAAIIGNFINNNNILIPKFIKYQMEEFIITSIQFYQNEYIQFSPDSQW